MKLIFALAVLPFVLAGPVENPDSNRYIYARNSTGDIVQIDLQAEIITPRVKTSDVVYYLYTKSNSVLATTIQNNNVDTLSSSNFDPSKKSVFIVHGWTEDRSSDVNTLIRQGVLSSYDYNVFVVDWSSYSKLLYNVAAGAVVGIGEVVGSFVNAIQNRYGLNGSSFVLVGFSLGAHVVGSAGATATQKIDHIIGLDPAGPLFSILIPSQRLDTSDGKFVQVIHTNGLSLGFSSSIGHVDYWPDGGMTQPGCAWDLTGSCSHLKAYKYLAEALTKGAQVFVARSCSSWSSYQLGLCRLNGQSNMGDITTATSGTGDYYLDVNTFSPYGKS